MSELMAQVNRFPAWHYEFKLGDVTTPIRDQRWVNRHAQRRRYFFDPLARAGVLKGKRVLDLGCNAGFWSLAAIEAGCSYVLGIDARETHIDQANLVFEATDVERSRYDFVQANFFDPGVISGSYDLVLCLGILYHTCKVFELLEFIANVNADLLLIDTAVSLNPAAVLELKSDPLDDPRMSADYELVMWPSATAVETMTRALGYECRKLRPEFSDWTGAEDYRDGKRFAFACTKRTGFDAIYGQLPHGVRGPP